MLDTVPTFWWDPLRITLVWTVPSYIILYDLYPSLGGGGSHRVTSTFKMGSQNAFSKKKKSVNFQLYKGI